MIKECLHQSEVRVKNIEGDGNCLFRAVGSQLYGESSYHDIIRSACMDYVELNKEAFSGFVHEYPSIEDYIQEKRRQGVWGDNIEIQGLSDLYRIPIYIYEKEKGGNLGSDWSGNHGIERSPQDVSRVVFKDNEEFVYRLLCKIEPRFSKLLDRLKSNYSNTRPIRLLYHDELHYDSLFFKREHQTPIINLDIGVVEAKGINDFKEYKLLEIKQASPEYNSVSPRAKNSSQKPTRVVQSSASLYSQLRKRGTRPFLSHLESSSESDYFISKSPLFSSATNRYRDEPDSVFKGSCLDKISDGEAHFERLSQRSEQLYSKFISDSKSFSEKQPEKPASSSKAKPLNTAHLGVVDRYARDVQLSSHQKELKKLLTKDLPALSSLPISGKNKVHLEIRFYLKMDERTWPEGVSDRSKKIIEALTSDKPFNGRVSEHFEHDFSSIFYEYDLSLNSSSIPTIVTVPSCSPSETREIGAFFSSITGETLLLLQEALLHHYSGRTDTLIKWKDSSRESGLYFSVNSDSLCHGDIPDSNGQPMPENSDEDIFEGVGGIFDSQPSHRRRARSLDRSLTPDLDEFVENIYNLSEESPNEKEPLNEYPKIEPTKSAEEHYIDRKKRNPTPGIKNRNKGIDYSLFSRRGPVRTQNKGNESIKLPRFEDSTSSYAECYLEVDGISQYETHHEELESVNSRSRDDEANAPLQTGDNTRKHSSKFKQKRKDKSINNEWKSIQKIMNQQNFRSLDTFNNEISRNYGSL
ncbi:putative cysteine protease [Cryptosporidium canis]|uniref:ubiquitinyl hydrolase 1 n=1 Tax=Cryptosporidium canis TaxID=195482 RepID=A0ABQ8P9A4_9CRYT|nr:putative cysteine protease [Cryptosporidium canis]